MVSELISLDTALGSGGDEVLAPVTFIGGSGGTQVHIEGWKSGKLIAKLGVYCGAQKIKAIKLWMTGDEEDAFMLFGDPTERAPETPVQIYYAEFAFQGERVTKMSLWGDGIGTRAGWIHLETSTGRTFDAGMWGGNKQTEYPVDVGSGVLVGALYNYGWDIDAHGYYFLSNAIVSSEMSNVSYPTLQSDSIGISPVELDGFHDDNAPSSPSPTSWSFKGTRTKKITTKWTLTTTNTYTVGLSATAAIPVIGNVDGEFKWTQSDVSSHETDEEKDFTFEWQVEGQLKPGESITLVAMTREGKISLPFNGTVTVTLKNGASFTFPVSGTYDGVTYTRVDVETS